MCMYMRLVYEWKAVFPSACPLFSEWWKWVWDFIAFFPSLFVCDVHTLINLNSIHDVLICSFSSFFPVQVNIKNSFISILSGWMPHFVSFSFKSFAWSAVGTDETFAKHGKSSKPCGNSLHICSTRKQQQHHSLAGKIEVKDSLMLIWDTYTKLW